MLLKNCMENIFFYAVFLFYRLLTLPALLTTKGQTTMKHLLIVLLGVGILAGCAGTSDTEYYERIDQYGERGDTGGHS